MLTSIPPAKVDKWAVANTANKPLFGVSDQSLADLEKLSPAVIRDMLAQRVRYKAKSLVDGELGEHVNDHDLMDV